MFTGGVGYLGAPIMIGDFIPESANGMRAPRNFLGI